MRGKLMLIGGGGIKRERNVALRLLSEFLKGMSIERLSLILPPSLRKYQKESQKKYEHLFKKIIKVKPEIILLHDHKTINKNQLESLEKTQFIFFGGGQQKKFIDALGKDCIKLIHERFEKDNLHIAGTSAGAMIFSKKIIAEGGNEDVQVDEPIRLTNGLGLLKHIMIDTHFIERSRFARLAHVLNYDHNYIGIGIESNTAIVFNDEHSFKTHGCGTVIIMDGSKLKKNKPSQKNCIFNLVVHLISPGCEVDLQELVISKKSLG